MLFSVAPSVKVFIHKYCYIDIVSGSYFQVQETTIFLFIYLFQDSFAFVIGGLQQYIHSPEDLSFIIFNKFSRSEVTLIFVLLTLLGCISFINLGIRVLSQFRNYWFLLAADI